ncbi:MAG: hypothetical protein SFZ24_02630 [Planctomycetota bacterium]|nr:hypothetical protein [Planctomycetota bacterium]
MHKRHVAPAVPLALTALVAPAGSAFAQITLVEQTRSVTARATAGSTVTNSRSATDFLLFNESVSAENSIPFVSSGFATARQRSSFDFAPGPALTADVTGFVQGTGSGGPPPGGGTGTSTTELTFTLAGPTDWQLRSSYFTGSPQGGYFNTVKLERLGPNPAVLADHSGFGVINLLTGGSTTPGTYKFTANFSAFGGPTATTVTFDIDLSLVQIPAPSAAALLAMLPMTTRRRRAR